MTPAQMEAGAIRAYGRKCWKTKLAKDLGCNECTIFRIMHRAQVPGVYDVAIAGLLEHKRREAELAREAARLLPRKFRTKKQRGKR